MALSQREALDVLCRLMVENVRTGSADLTARQQAVLLIVGMEAGPHTVRGLALRLNLAKPAVSRALDALARHDFIRRRPDEDDLRSVFIERTAAGGEHLRALVAPLTQFDVAAREAQQDTASAA